MSRNRFLMVTGTARSGSTLLSMMLNAHHDMRVASDPYLPLFRSLRNALIRHRASPDLVRSFNPAGPFQDYYFADEQLAVLDCVLGSDLHVPFDPHEGASLVELSRARGQHNCPDLVQHYDRLPAPTYKDIFDNALDVIASGRDGRDCRWVGFKDVWTIEFIAPLARAYPDARFIVLHRAPGAVVASLAGMAQRDPSQAAHTLSYLRHCRKGLALATHYQNDPTLRDRVFVLTYEQLVREPERLSRELCIFLDTDFDPAMLDAGRYIDYATGTVWAGNSSFEMKMAGIQTGHAERWRQKLAPEVVELVDFVCGPEMALAGYQPQTSFESTMPGPESLDYLIRNGEGYASWRCDFADPQRDYGFELFRWALLGAGPRCFDTRLLRRSFLFEDVFAELGRLRAGRAAA